MRSFRNGLILGAILSCALTWYWYSAEGRAMSEAPFRERIKVPPIPEGLTWINTAGPIQLSELRGKFVLMDFWTYCCINCMHILPELKKLERAYPNNLVVIGVHSAKFAAEQDSKNIAEAVERYQIEHPVVNDSNHVLWDRFEVNSWPTVILIDPEGYAVWGTSGEITFAQVDAVLKPAIPFYRKHKLLDESPLRFDLEAHKAKATPLRFPGKVLADEPGGRLFIADSNHNRIVVTRLDGALLAVIGSGASGSRNGDFAAAEFNQPQGMAVQGDTLYVADTENHAIRKVDLAAKSVTTVAGTGRQSREPLSPGKMAAAAKIPLNSPWDLWLHEGDLYVAMAGSHQIWKMRLERATIGPYAGNGREDIVDGPLLPRRPYQDGYSSFAQPSGLASDGVWLYVADSEGSSIRAVPLDPRKEVTTVVGTSHLASARLFTFGDVDGPPQQARLQHALGVAFCDGLLYVADTYNSKIKVVDPATGRTETLVGTGKPGTSDDPPQFDEPAGIAAAAGKLYVADTNNHLIRVVDLAGKKVSTLAIPGLQTPKTPAEPEPVRTAAGTAEQKLGPVRVRPEGGSIRLAVTLDFAPGYKINPLAPLIYQVDRVAADGKRSEGKGVESKDRGPPDGGLIRQAVLGKPARVKPPAASFEIALPVEADTGRDTVRVTVNYYYCREGADGLCKAGAAAWLVPVEAAADAASSVVPLLHRAR
jgi:sugar lactone lactonase YvrE/thiol-disulfide isomerase/thioredoxin